MSAIYKLIDPRNKEVRYIGKSDKPSRRLGQHIRLPSSLGMKNWIDDLKAHGMRPSLEIIEQCEDWIEREKFWVDKHRREGSILLNVLEPGINAAFQQHYTEVVRSKIRAAHKGKIVSPEIRARMSAARIGMKFSPEHRAAIGAASRGRKQSPEAIEKSRAARIGRKLSPETCAKMSASAKNRSPEHLAKISAALKGRKPSPQTIAAGKLANTGKVISMENRIKTSVRSRGNKYILGIKHSPEIRAKMTASQKARWARRKEMECLQF